MKRSLIRFLPTVLGFVIAFAVVSVAWVLQEAYIRGISITSVGEGVEIVLKQSGSNTETTDLMVDVGSMKLKPCKYYENVKQYSDENLDYVTGNTDYVKSITVSVKTTEICNIYASQAVTGDLPVGVVINGVEIDENGVNIGRFGNEWTTLTLEFYVKGDSITQNGTAGVQITLRGEAV